jgi:YD repeat-containing protein
MADANGNTTTYSYSGSTYIGSLMKAANLPRGNTPYTQSFDPSTGGAITQIDSKGNISKLAYVSGGDPGVTMLTDPLSHVTTFNYTDPALQNLTSIVDAAGNTSSYAYDSLERPITFTDRLGNKSSLAYDPASGYPASFTDAQGNTTGFTYQAQVQGSFTFYNLAKIAYPDGTSEGFTYDGSGNILTATDQAGKTTAYTYNALGQAVTETNPAGGVTTATYHADGTLATAQDPSGNVTTYS